MGHQWGGSDDKLNPKQQAWFRHLDHARLTGAKPTYRTYHDDYYVISPRNGDKYFITPVHGDRKIRYVCTCPAGTMHKLCWHVALIAALPGEIQRRRDYRGRETDE